MFLMPHRHFSWVWFGSFNCVIVLTAFIVEICATLMLGHESLLVPCNELHSSSCRNAGPGY